jgi:hypothetical protein
VVAASWTIGSEEDAPYRHHGACSLLRVAVRAPGRTRRGRMPGAFGPRRGGERSEPPLISVKKVLTGCRSEVMRR